jgi:hypothetical protein
MDNIEISDEDRGDGLVQVRPEAGEEGGCLSTRSMDVDEREGANSDKLGHPRPNFGSLVRVTSIRSHWAQWRVEAARV